MYEAQLKELRSVMDKIRSGQYRQEKKVGRRQASASLVSKPQREYQDPEDQDMTSAFLQGFEAEALSEFAASHDIIDQAYNEGDTARYTEDGNRRPKAREDYYADTGLTEDPAFMEEVERLTAKYPGLTKSEIFRTIQGESAFNPRAQNANSKATGLFQFIPSTAAELGFTVDEIKDMAPAEQLRVYDKYLDKWNYQGGNALGIMQAAPAYANAAPDEIIYERGTKAWEQNPGWRGPNGDITVSSINSYYRNQ